MISLVIGFFTVAGGLIARDRYVLKLISDTKIDCGKVVKESSKELHERISKHRDEVSDTYVSKTESEAQQKAIEALLINVNRNVDKLVEGQHRTNERIDNLFTEVASKQNKSNS